MPSILKISENDVDLPSKSRRASRLNNKSQLPSETSNERTLVDFLSAENREDVRVSVDTEKDLSGNRSVA